VLAQAQAQAQAQEQKQEPKPTQRKQRVLALREARQRSLCRRMNGQAQ
jgi:hypothetical protein